MGVVSTGNLPKLLWPGVNAIYGRAYAEWKREYPFVFKTYPSRGYFEEDVGVTGFGLAPIKPEGEGVHYDTMYQGYICRYTHVEYSLGFIITRNMYEDNRYQNEMITQSQGLAFSINTTRETVAANVLNRAFTAAYAGGDGLELCSTLHTNVSGGTYQNEPTTNADLSEASLEQACIDIAKWTNDRGLQIAVRPIRLVVPPDLDFEATRILKSTLQNDTANNAINALRSMGSIPEGHSVNHYLTDTDAWFIITDCPNGMKHFERRKDDFDKDNDFDTSNAKFKAESRYSFGWTDPKGIYGCVGA